MNNQGFTHQPGFVSSAAKLLCATVRTMEAEAPACPAQVVESAEVPRWEKERGRAERYD